LPILFLIKIRKRVNKNKIGLVSLLNFIKKLSAAAAANAEKSFFKKNYIC
jgi:hypothetical protein